MRATDGETRRRAKDGNERATTDIDVWPDDVPRVAHRITTSDRSWFDTIGDWLGSIGDALEGLDLGDIGFDW